MLPVVHTKHKWQCVATRGGQGCTEALLALVATKAGVAKEAGGGEPHWALIGAPIWHYIYWLPLVGYTRAKWQCLATRGQGAQQHC